MGIPSPTAADLARIAGQLGLGLDGGDLAFFRDQLRGALDAYAWLDSLPDALPQPRWPRLPGFAPSAGDNPFGAWARVADVRGAAEGRLAGRRLAITDSICLAGVPLMSGPAALAGYTPEVDATVVARILDAGGIVAGTSAGEDDGFACASHANARGPVDNPHRSGFTAGGTSSGSAALVAGGEVDMALGTDQGGSIRVAAACCGIVGLKPTHGLVPGTGVLGMDHALDHVGPLARTVADNAQLLDIIAGADGLDSRQNGVVVDDYSADLAAGAAGLRIGVLNDAFDLPQSDRRTEHAVLSAVAALQAAGAMVVDVAVPLHAYGSAIWLPLAAEGGLATMVHGNGFGHGPKGVYLPSAMQRQALGRSKSNLLPNSTKLTLLLGQYMADRYGGHYYGRAQNVLRLLSDAYDSALADVDVLVCPTLPFPPPPRPAGPAGREEMLAAGFAMTATTAPFNATGHPSLSLPCGWVDGLPVGLMLTGRRWSERLLYRIAAAFEGVLADATGAAARLRSHGD